MLKTFFASFGEINEGFKLGWRGRQRAALLFFLLGTVLAPLAIFFMSSAAGGRHPYVAAALAAFFFGLRLIAACRMAYYGIKANDYDGGVLAMRIVNALCFAVMVAMVATI